MKRDKKHVLINGAEALDPRNLLRVFEVLKGRKATPEEIERLHQNVQKHPPKMAD